MQGSRNFSDGTCDCSGAVYYGLMQAGGSDFGYIPSTETLHAYLTQNGFKLIAENIGWNAQRGDVVIWGKQGFSAGAGGHTGIFVNNVQW
ncbi:peptidoglycan amidohydrolase family protein, partial [Klebsiella pneumoniae]|uniref:peptidoglycan amidohydrolase family protein n=1 Tax=Klebsiella pneumoniae TaxID=573 RepID=UPI0027308951